ncbi:MAG TPA: DinB family protein [Thermoanaerobaculia bacterium]|nr:DinB family protein [Thermoanaerobaculia bacterium]
MTKTPDEPRRTLARLLRRSQAHAGLEGALEGFPAELAGRQVEGHPHTAWQLVEHLRLAAEDLVSYGRDADYREKEFPAGYWPATSEPPSEEAWRSSVEGLLAAVEAMAALVEDPGVDLYAQVPAAQRDGHHVFRAALIVLDHDGYHAGQLIALRRALGIWPAG